MAIIGAASGWGGMFTGSGDGPDALQHSDFVAALENSGIKTVWETTVYPLKKTESSVQEFTEDSLEIISDHAHRLSQHVAGVVRHGRKPIVIGGDHSCAVGTWSGVTQGLQAQGRFGLIWVDAHMDAHTPETRHEGKWGGFYHGQPLACLLGYGEDALTSIGGNQPKISPEHVSLIGIRSFEEGEQALMEKLGVRVYYMHEVKERGFSAIMKEAIERASSGTLGYGMTVDVDAFDPTQAPGAASKEKDGLLKEDVLPALSVLAEDSRFKALEIAEYNPHMDQDDITADLLKDIIVHCFK